MKRDKDERNVVNSLNEEECKYIEDYLFNWITESYDKHSDLRDAIFRWRMFYGMQVQPKTSPFVGCSNMMFDMYHAKVTGYHARLKEVLFAGSPMFEVDPWEIRDQEMCKARERFLEFKLTEPWVNDVTKTIKDTLSEAVAHDAILCGTGIMYTPMIIDEIVRKDVKDFDSKEGLSKYFGEERAKKEFSETYNSLNSQAANVEKGKNALIVPETVSHEYDEEVRQHKPVYVPRENFVISQGASTIDEATLVGYVHDTSWNELIKLYKKGLFERVPHIAYGNGEDSLRASDEDEDDYYDVDSDDKLKDFWNRTDVELFIGEVMLDMSIMKKLANLKDNPAKADLGYDDEPDADDYFAGLKKYKIWIATEGDNARLLRMEEYQPLHGRSNFTAHYIKRVGKRFDGIGLGQLLERPLIEANKLFNMFSDATLLELMPIFIVPGISDFDPNKPEFQFKPYAVWRSDAPIDKMNFKAPSPDKVMTVLDKLSRSADNVSVSELLTGRESQSDPNAPAAKTAMLLKQSQIAIGEGISQFSLSMRPIPYNIIEELYQLGDDQMEYRIMGPKSQLLWQEMDRKDLAEKADYRVRGKVEDLTKLSQADSAVQDIQIFMQHPAIAQDPERLNQLFLNAAEAREVKNQEIIFPSKKEIELQMQAMVTKGIIQVMQADAQKQAEEARGAMQEHLNSAKESARLGDMAQAKLMEGTPNEQTPVERPETQV